MATIVKIKIKDNEEFRRELDMIYENAQQVTLAKWALTVAKHILELASIEYMSITEIVDGFKTNELWQVGKVRMYDVRQAGFQVHRLAREEKDPTKISALRTTGQAIGTGHMREHAMVCSDYAVKTVGLLSNNDMKQISAELLWQIGELKKLLSVTTL